MSSISWWRSWHGAPMDHKYQVIAAKAKTKVGIVSAVMWALLDYASQNEPRGSVIGFDAETYSIYSGFPENEIVTIIQVMSDKGIIKAGMLVNWEKRQPKREDDSSARVAKFRAKEHDIQQDNELKRDVTRCNAPDKEKETDTEEDKEKEENDNAFSKIQRIIEKTTGLMPAGDSAIKAINEIVNSGAIEEDVKAGADWLISQGKTIKYYSSLVGPTKTAMARRIQKPKELAGVNPYEGAKKYE